MSFLSTPTLNTDDLNRILFDTSMDYQPSSSSSSTAQPSCSTHTLHYPDTNAAYFGGGCGDNTFGSMFNAAQMSMDQKHALYPQDILQSLMGDVAPAAAAAIQSPLLDSPCLNTPYLDSSMNTPYTPFTPATAFTPNLAAFQASPHFSPFIEGEGDFNNDISVANYLDGFKKQPSADLFKDLALPSQQQQQEQVTSAAAFNGDPSQLLLDKNKDWQHQEDVTAAADSLFPPLAPEEAYADTKPSYDHLDHIDAFLGNFDFNDAGHHDNPVMDNMHHEDHQESSQSSARSSPYSDNHDDMPGNDNNEGDDQSGDDKNNKKRKASSQADDEEESNSSEQEEKRAQPKRKRVKHQRRSTSGDVKKFECGTCHQVFNRRYNLNTHEKTHDKARFKEFGCYVCDKRFDRKHDRDRHISTVHHGERLYACHDCETAFSRKDALTRHLVQKHGHDAIV